VHRSCIEISYSDLFTRSFTETLQAFCIEMSYMHRSSLENSDGDIAKDLSYRPGPGILSRHLTSLVFLTETYQILHTISFKRSSQRELEDLPWHLFLIFFAIFCKDLHKGNLQNLPWESLPDVLCSIVWGLLPG
jgi:hypothetical protein